MGLLAGVTSICFSLLWIFDALEERVAQPAFCGHLNQDFLWLFWLTLAWLSTLLLEFEGVKFGFINLMVVKFGQCFIVAVPKRRHEVPFVQLIVYMNGWMLPSKTL